MISIAWTVLLNQEENIVCIGDCCNHWQSPSEAITNSKWISTRPASTLASSNSSSSCASTQSFTDLDGAWMMRIFPSPHRRCGRKGSIHSLNDSAGINFESDSLIRSQRDVASSSSALGGACLSCRVICGLDALGLARASCLGLGEASPVFSSAGAELTSALRC